MTLLKGEEGERTRTTLELALRFFLGPVDNRGNGAKRDGEERVRDKVALERQRKQIFAASASEQSRLRILVRLG